MKIWEWKTIRNDQEIYYYNASRNFIPEEFAGQLFEMIQEEKERKNKRGIVFLCIGTDRSTGDSLGPLIGYKLNQMKISKATVFGTLERPVHAMNLVSKELRSVGDIFITGIVGSCGNYDPLMLQSVRLSVVMQMADCISRSISLVEKFWDNTAFV